MIGLILAIIVLTVAVVFCISAIERLSKRLGKLESNQRKEIPAIIQVEPMVTPKPRARKRPDVTPSRR